MSYYPYADASIENSHFAVDDQFCVEAASATDFSVPDWERRDRFLKTHEWEFDGPKIASSNIAVHPDEKAEDAH